MNIETMTLDDLAEIIEQYPWYGIARKELCLKMSEIGGTDWGIDQYVDCALYVRSRSIISDLIRSASKQDYYDKNLEALLKSYIANVNAEKAKEQAKPEVRVVGGDFFTKEQYEKVKLTEDNFLYSKELKNKPVINENEGVYTETLAEIYVEQGYYQEAEEIYSKLILLYPEKSAYFASLIEKIKKEI